MAAMERPVGSAEKYTCPDEASERAEKLAKSIRATTLLPDEACARAGELSRSIGSSHTTLQLMLDHYEEMIRKRWQKKNHDQRRKVLSEAWPGMSKKHRPDIEAHRREVASIQASSEKTKFRDAYMWPHMNLEDLLPGSATLRLLNSRGRNEPSIFAFSDWQSFHVGLVMHRLDEVLLPSYNMVMEGSTTDVYGGVCLQDTVASLDIISWPFDQGFLVLQVQARIMEFLCKFCHIILRDQVTDDSLQRRSRPQPIASYSRENMSPETFARDSCYLVPRKIDLGYLGKLVASRLDQALDHLWALREDPGYFAEVVKDWGEHSMQMIPDRDGRAEPALASEYWNMITHRAIVNGQSDVLWWRTLNQQFQDVSRVQQNLKLRGNNQDPTYDEDFVHVIRKLNYLILKNDLMYVVEPARIKFWSSPPIRSSSVRRSDGHVLRIEPRGNVGAEDYLIWLFSRMTPSGTQVLGLQDISGEVERLMTLSNAVKARITPLVARCISDLGIMGKILHEIYPFLPEAWLWHAKRPDQAAEEAGYQNWFKILEHPIKEVSKMGYMRAEDKGKYLSLGENVQPGSRAFEYPIAKPRTKKNHEIMRLAEKNLDALWEKYDRHIERVMDKATVEFIQGLTSRRGGLYRTGEWVEPERPRKTKEETDQQLVNLDFGPHVEDPHPRVQPQKEKVKTRGDAHPAPSQPDTTDPTSPKATPAEPGTLLATPPHHYYVVSRRAHAVFSTLFYTPSSATQPGQLAWTDFVHAMDAIGFAPAKLFGSVWQFVPRGPGEERRLGHGINFHEPHPDKKMDYRVARRFGRRLARNYGFDASCFGVE